MTKLLAELLLLREVDEAKPLPQEDAEPADPAEDPPEEPTETPEEPAPEPEPEEPKKPETAEEVFKSGDVEEYVNRNLYDIRELKAGEKVKTGGKTISAGDDEYLVRNHKDLTDVKIISSDEYENSFEQIRLNQAPDAEGFTLHRSSDILEVVEYSEDDELAITANDGEAIELAKGDYLCRYRSANDSYFVLSSHDLKLEYKKL